MLVVIAGAATVNLGARAMLGHAVPGDFVQEVVAARSVRARTTLYPADVNRDVRTWLAEDPPAVPRWLPDRVTRWLDGRRRDGRNRLVAQAHPPTLLLVATVPVIVLGAYGAYWALTILSIGAAALSAGWMLDAFAPAASTRERILAALMLVSWQPVLATVRDGQVSVLIGALLVLAWADLRRASDTRAGLAVGLAAALKLYPLLMLMPLALRRRRAFAAACAVLAVAAAAVLAVAGPDAWAQYMVAARSIGRAFATAPYNLSLLARVGVLVPAPLVLPVYGALAVILVGATLVTLRHADGIGTRAIDFAWGGFVTLAVLLSPVAWHHYIFVLALPLAVLAVAAWTGGGRAALTCACGLAIVLSVPDDLWRALWRQSPGVAGLLVSPGVAVLLLWAALLRGVPRLSRLQAAP